MTSRGAEQLVAWQAAAAAGAGDTPVLDLVGSGTAAAMLGTGRENLVNRLLPAGVIRPCGKLPGANGAWLFTLEEVRRVMRVQAEYAGSGDRRRRWARPDQEVPRPPAQTRADADPRPRARVSA